jgi:hypothetical protein
VGEAAVDQGDPSFAATSESPAKRRGEQQAGDAASDDDDAGRTHD